MNYAFGVEFVEVDPLGLGADRIEYGDEQLRERLRRELSADPARYRGLHGSAILSRYPIRRARVLRLKACYDWYGEERTAIARIEEACRWTAERVFIERVSRELRHGNRMALIAEVAVPESPTGQVTVVAAHLENKCNPACRREQMEQILTAIQEVEDPVILGGDLNTTGASGAPTSVEREISKRIGDADFWALNALRWFTPLVLPRALMFPANYFKNYQDPTARHVPVFATNREAALFRMIERFRFADGHAFDFRGSFGRTANRQRTLGNSNERGPKGFKPTFTFRRDYGGLVGRFKLDWFLIKPLVDDPREPDGSEWFAPHFPVTMSEINGVLPSGLSDHAPITVDLPLVEMRDLGAPPLLSR
ncbi:MAG: hypothetical protein IPM24_17485 [Bryobacterales bacterium]|nr:hypothetical protein [Bryobacterales bacterium]